MSDEAYFAVTQDQIDETRAKWGLTCEDWRIRQALANDERWLREAVLLLTIQLQSANAELAKQTERAAHAEFALRALRDGYPVTKSVRAGCERIAAGVSGVSLESALVELAEAKSFRELAEAQLTDLIRAWPKDGDGLPVHPTH